MEKRLHINGHPSCIAHSIAYMSLIIGGNIIGGAVENCLVQNNPYVMNAFSILFGMVIRSRNNKNKFKKKIWYKRKYKQ